MVTLMAGDVTMAVDIDCTRNHQEPHEIPISFFVDFVFFFGLGGSSRQCWSEATHPAVS